MKVPDSSPALAALLLALPVCVAQAEPISQSKVTLALTLSQTVPSLTPRPGTGITVSGDRVHSHQYTDRQGNTISETASTILRTRFGNRELLNKLKSLGVIPDITGYSLVRENNANVSGSYFLHRKLANGQVQRIDITAYMVDSLPLMRNPVSSASGRSQTGVSGTQSSLSHQVSSTGVGALELKGLFPAVAGDGSAGSLVVEGPATTRETYVTGKGYSFSAGFSGLSGGYTRVLRASGEAAGLDDHVYAEGSLTISTSTFKPVVSSPAGNTSSASVHTGSGSLNTHVYGAGTVTNSTTIPIINFPSGNTSSGSVHTGAGGLVLSGGNFAEAGGGVSTDHTAGAGSSSILPGQATGGVLTINNTAPANLSGIIKQGSGTLTLQGTNAYTGNLTSNGGTAESSLTVIPQGGSLSLNGASGAYSIFDAFRTGLFIPAPPAGQ